LAKLLPPLACVLDQTRAFLRSEMCADVANLR
jgi:hypothetical protein